MDNVKKFFTMGISVLLIITSVIFAPSERSDVNAGKGKGKDTKITTVEELSDVFEFMANTDFSEDESSGKNALTNLSYSSDDSDDEEEESKNKHTSVTLHSESVSTSKYSLVPSSKSSYHSRSYSIDIDRNLSVYMTTEAAYYKSKGNLNYSYKYYDADEKKNVSEAYFISFDIEMLFDKTGMLMKFNKWDMSGDTDFSFKDEVFGKWIRFGDEEFAEGFLDIDLTNRSVLSKIGYITSQTDEDLFVGRGNSYSVKDDFLEEVLEEIFDVGLDKESLRTGGFTVDFSSSKKPSLFMWLDYAYQDYDENIGKQNSSAYAYEKIRFENIDNTVIKPLDEDIEIEVITDPDIFEDKYVVEE